MIREHEFVAEADGERIDSFLVRVLPELTRSAVQRLIAEDVVTAAGHAVAKNHRLKAGEAVRITIPEPHSVNIVAEDIPLDVVYEDGELLVVNKPKGMVVHPAAGNPDKTLVNALLSHCRGSLSGINGELRPGIVHRIDKDTSGLLIVAKSDRAHIGLAAQIKAHSFLREYWAVLCGSLQEEALTVDKPVGRSKKDRKKMAVTPDGRNAVTHITVLHRYKGYTLVKCRLETGRTHQIRVHAASVGHPIAGDAVYGKPEKSLTGQCLHAKKIGFVHPVTGAWLEFDSPLPDYFSDFIDTLTEV